MSNNENFFYPRDELAIKIKEIFLLPENEHIEKLKNLLPRVSQITDMRIYHGISKRIACLESGF